MRGGEALNDLITNVREHAEREVLLDLVNSFSMKKCENNSQE